MSGCVLAVMGTRPEAIKLSPIVLSARADAGLEIPILSTGQHREVFQDVLDLFGLDVAIQADVMRHGQSLAQLSSRCLTEFEPLIADANPDLVLVQGDTTSAAMGALAAFYQHVPVWHVEAGLRTPTILRPFPEELNRRIITRIACRHFAPTASARGHLLREGVPQESVVITGNTAIDALLRALQLQPNFADARLADWVSDVDELLVVTSHRRENWGGGVFRIASAVRELADEHTRLKVVYAAHPNPAVREELRSAIGTHPRVYLTGPIKYGDFVRLLAEATVIITDSGGIQEEAPTLGVPVLVTRRETERTESIAAGVSILVGTRTETIVGAARDLLVNPDARAAMRARTNPYGDGRAAERIVSDIQTHMRATGEV